MSDYLPLFTHEEPMDCILMRHDIAVEREEWNGTDHDRPLTDRGAKRVAEVAAGMQWMEAHPGPILSSPLVRAVESAKIVHDVLKVRSTVRLIDELVPGATPERLLTVLQRLPPETCVLCIGHEPHLSSAAGLMLAARVSPAFPFKKAGACLIELVVPVKPGKGILRWWMEPKQLRALGKSSKEKDVV